MVRSIVLLSCTMFLLANLGTTTTGAIPGLQTSYAGFGGGGQLSDEVHGVRSGASGPSGEPQIQNLELVGFHDLGGGGFNTDVWAHGDFAYVGTFGIFVPGRSELCPGTGVKVVDISDPTIPLMVAAIASPEGSRANDIKVGKIDTPFFHGDMLVHSIEPCAPGGPRGFALYDVSQPTSPLKLSQVATIGSVHNAFLLQQDKRAFVLLAIPLAEIFSGRGDLQIFEVTGPGIKLATSCGS